MKIIVESYSEKHEIEILPGETTVGGTPADHIRIEGLGEKSLVVMLRSDSVTLTSTCPIRIGSVYYTSLDERLWLRGETLTVCDELLLTRAQDDLTTPFNESVVQRWMQDADISPYHPTLRTVAPTLVCVYGKAKEQFCWLGRHVRVGRSARCEFQIDDEHVAVEHFSIIQQRNRYFIDVENDAPRVLLNGARIRQPTAIQHLDAIQFARMELRAIL